MICTSCQICLNLVMFPQVVLFVDDLNMPQPDQYHSQPPLELLRQFLDSRGFYDSKNLQWKEVHDVTLLAACAPPGGGRSTINDRLLRHFRLGGGRIKFSIDYSDHKSIIIRCFRRWTVSLTTGSPLGRKE